MESFEGPFLKKDFEGDARYHEELRATTIFATMISTIILGTLFFLLGRFRLTKAVQYVPTSVIEAFLSCVGFKVFKYALKLSKYKTKMFVPAALIGVPLYFLKAYHVGNPAIVIPAMLFAPLPRNMCWPRWR